MFPSKQGPLAFNTPQSTSLKGFPTSSLCKFLSVFHPVAVPQNSLCISISRICSHSCPHLDASVWADSDFTRLSYPGQIPALPLLFSPPSPFLPLDALDTESSALSHLALHYLCNFDLSMCCLSTEILRSQIQGLHFRLLHIPFSNFQGSYKYLIDGYTWLSVW